MKSRKWIADIYFEGKRLRMRGSIEAGEPFFAITPHEFRDCGEVCASWATGDVELHGIVVSYVDSPPPESGGHAETQ